jgi:head-tail adaptor
MKMRLYTIVNFRVFSKVFIKFQYHQEGAPAMQINPGIFKKKIQICVRIITKDPDGFPISNETVLTTTWAQVTNKSGTEINNSNSDFSEVKTRFFMRTPKQRIDHANIIRFNGNEYNVVYINDYGYDGIYTEIIAELVKK